MSYSFSLAGFNGKVSYTFGKPAHNTVQTIGEVYYGEISRSFGRFSLFGKAQYINGYYEKSLALFAEAKITGFQNAEIKLTCGNGDFWKFNTTKNIISIEFNTWW